MATPTKVTVTVRDNVDENDATFSFYLGSAINTIASIEAAAQAILEEASVLMTGTITKVQFTYGIDISGWTLAEAPGADTDRLIGGRITMSAITNPNAKARITLPTFDIATYVPSPGNDVDQSQGDVAEFIGDLQGTILVNSSDVEVGVVDSFKEVIGGKSR